MRSLLLLQAIVAVCLAGAWWWPKSQPLSLNKDYYRGYYRGLGLHDGPGFFGKQFYFLVFDIGDGGHWEVPYSRPGFNPFRGYYPDGTLREQSECYVELNGGADPVPDNNHVRWGKYYLPDGTLGSEIHDGSGIQTYWYPDGTKQWELELRDFKRVRHSMWYSNGQLRQTQHYVDGVVDGPFETYSESGTAKTKGEYSAGDRVGKWVRFNDQGAAETIEDYSTKPATITDVSDADFAKNPPAEN